MTQTLQVKAPALTQDQQTVFNQITSLIDERVTNFLQSYNIQDYMISLTGAAGTGKTFLTVEIIKHLIAKYSHVESGYSFHNFFVTAPTNKAVSVIGKMLKQQGIEADCKTIHSFLGIKPFVDYEKGIETFKVDKQKQDKVSTTVLIVDESSMIGEELFEYIQEAIETDRAKVVLFIGDPYQLLPISKADNQIYKLPQSFSLNEVVRHAKDSYIIKIATELRKRIQSKNYIPLSDLFHQHASQEIDFFYEQDAFTEDFYKNERWFEEEKIIATHKNKDVDAFNRIIRAKYWEQKGIHDPQTLLSGDQVRFNNPYSINDKIIYYNGQIVEIASATMNYHQSLGIYYWVCETDSPSFRVVDPVSMKAFNSKLSSIAKQARSEKFPKNKELWSAFFQVRDMFADVQYIHASTIHKLQGSTYDVSYVDLFSLCNNNYISDDEKYRLAYVALTRASKDVKVFLPKAHRETNIDELDMEKRFKQVDALLQELKI